jgi:hypothetical protein
MVLVATHVLEEDAETNEVPHEHLRESLSFAGIPTQREGLRLGA